MNFLNQPMAAPGIQNAGASPDLEAEARSKGFRNYEEMMAWGRQRFQPRDNQTTRGQSMWNTIQSAVKNPGQAADQMLSIHPRNMFNRIRDAWRGAMERQEQ